MPKKKLKKPVKKVSEPYWDFYEVMNYLGKFAGRDLTNWAGSRFDGNKETLYLNFWHWIIDRSDIHCGCYYYLPVKDYLEHKNTPPWVKEILSLFKQEFEEDEMRFWVEW